VFNPHSRRYPNISSALKGILRKLYVCTPICTPPNLELGLPEEPLQEIIPEGSIAMVVNAAELPINFRLVILFPKKLWYSFIGLFFNY
jgi:hypothetical protein